jgi:hypothetical protein
MSRSIAFAFQIACTAQTLIESSFAVIVICTPMSFVAKEVDYLDA